jgi:deazaflavin-dependent oxidoreductase (nitroreductase family)
MTRGKQESQFLYLTTTGRISGRPREIEIWFVQFDGRYYILAEHFHRTQWVKNIIHNSRVRFRVDDRELEATARVLDETRDKTEWQLARRLEQEKYGWSDGLVVELTPDTRP